MQMVGSVSRLRVDGCGGVGGSCLLPPPRGGGGRGLSAGQNMVSSVGREMVTLVILVLVVVVEVRRRPWSEGLSVWRLEVREVVRLHPAGQLVIHVLTLRVV